MDWILLRSLVKLHRDSKILPWERQDGPQILLSGRGQVDLEAGVKVRNIMKSLRQSLPQRCPAFHSKVPLNRHLVQATKIHLLAVLQDRRHGKPSLLVPACQAPDDDPGVHILALLTSQPGYNIGRAKKGRE